VKLTTAPLAIGERHAWHCTAPSRGVWRQSEPIQAGYDGAMSEGRAKPRWFRFGLHRLFTLVTIVAILTAWGASNWRRQRERREFLAAAGAVNGHARTVQGYRSTWNRWSIKWWLFGEKRIVYMNLYPGSFDDDYLAHASDLFPETKIISSSDQNAGDEISY
jgi:hypothetical protein